MRRRSQLVAVPLLAVLMLAMGCSPTSPEPTYATVTVGPVTYRVELAQTADQQREGLADRPTLPAGTGMLFRFGSRKQQQVWMAGMSFPLDIAWIADNKIVAMETLDVCTEADENACPRSTSPSPVDALLEVPAHSLAATTRGTAITVEELP